MKKSVLLLLLLIMVVFSANAQKISTKVIDNKGTIKWVIDSTTAVITKGDSTILYVTPTQLQNLFSTGVKYTDTAAMLANYVNNVGNGLTKTGQIVRLGGALEATTTIATSATQFLNITGLQTGAATDSVMVVNPTTGKLSIISSATLFTNLTASNGLTKFGNNIQLGGTLTVPTVINTDATNTLTIGGLPSGNLATDSILVSNGVTGQLKKVTATSLLQSGDQTFTTTAAQSNYTVANMPGEVSKVLVFRNGAKLLVTTDYTVASGVVTFVPAMAGLIAANDIVEVQWVK